MLEVAPQGLHSSKNQHGLLQLLQKNGGSVPWADQIEDEHKVVLDMIEVSGQ